MAKLTQADLSDAKAIVDLIVDEGMSNADIATKLDISIKRVATLVGKIRNAKKAAGKDPLPERRGATEDTAGKEALANL